MAASGLKRRRDGDRTKKSKKVYFKKQKNYHSSSESEDAENDVADFAPVSVEDSDAEDDSDEAEDVQISVKQPSTNKQVDDPQHEAPQSKGTSRGIAEADRVLDGDKTDESETEDLDGDGETEQPSDASTDADTEGAVKGGRKKRKRNDPTAFANSISKILASKLSTSKRDDPVLSRSVIASAASRELTDARLEAKARRKLHAEKRQALEKGRVKDVLGLESTDVSTAQIKEQEKRLKKTAQRGVVRLFNAVRAAQVQGELARQEARKHGVVGMAQREERVSEMSKKGFLDLIAQGGKKTPALNV